MKLSELKTQYSNIRRIKKGGQKSVFVAEDSNGRKIALQIIDVDSTERALQEINILRDLELDNIPKIIDSGIVEDDTINEDVVYIVEEYIEGISLRDWIKNGNKADISFAYALLHTLIQNEIELEAKSILHRDINPNNIMLGADGTIYLIDFGLAKILGGTSFTNTSFAFGPCTPGYAPHEQFANQKLLQDVRTDLFQIGVTVYECCTGQNPFIEKNDTVYQVLNKTITVFPKTLSILGDKKGMLSQFINMLMAKNQSQRPDTAVDAMRYLEAIKTTLDLEE